MRVVWLLSLVLAGGGALVGCGSHPQHPAAPSLPAVPVRVQTVQPRQRTATEEVVGTVRSKLRSVIEAKVSGRIARMLVVPGQQVQAGALLVELDAREIQARYDQARALLEQAEREYKRRQALLKDNTISPAEFDAAESQLRVAQAAVQEAETLLTYTKVVAPFTGLVTAKRADVGDLAAPGKPLLEMEDPTTLRLEADVPEALLDKVKLGDKLPVTIPAAGLTVVGVVSEITPVADPASRTFPVKVDLPPAAGLRSGQFGRVAVPVAQLQAIRVPSQAVILRGQMELAFVVSDGRAQMRLVKTGKRLDGEVEIVSGLNAGEQLVVDGAAGLRDGQPVTIQ
jgi:RND family efflux transporter MFP subunit